MEESLLPISEAAASFHSRNQQFQRYGETYHRQKISSPNTASGHLSRRYDPYLGKSQESTRLLS
jgi:hypothetical protein